MIKVVLDTQSALSGLLDYAAPREIILLAYRRRIQLWGSKITFGEFCRVARYPRLEKRILSKYLTIHTLEHEYERLLNFCSTDGVAPGILVPADRDDESFIRVAIVANAKFLISRDKHLLELSNYDSIQILRPSDFMKFWRMSNLLEKKGLWNRLKWRIWGKRGGT